MLTIHGEALHYFDEKANADKYYRAFWWQRGQTPAFATYEVIFHFGRAGTEGQIQRTPFASEAAARDAVRKKSVEKQKKGYNALGKGTATMIDIDRKPDIVEASARLLRDITLGGRSGTGRGGFAFIIYEEPDILDLLAAK